MAVTLLYVFVLLSVLTAPSLTDTCYSTSTGYSECWSGCCGPSDDRDCCSSSGIVIGVAVGGSVILLAFVVVGVCLMCKCHPKFRDASASRHGRDRHRRRGRRRDVEAGAWAMRRSPRMVHPVGPPDYSTATQQRAPHVVPTIIPLSPPPPYTETVPPPPTAPPPARDNRTRNRTQQVTVTSSEGGGANNGAQTVATSGTVQGETRTSNKKATQETSQTHKPSAAAPCDERGTNVQQTRENGGQRVPAVQQQQQSESAASTVTGSGPTRTVAATSVAGPSTAAPGSRRAVHGISGGTGGGGTGRNSGTLLVVEDLAMI